MPARGGGDPFGVHLQRKERDGEAIAADAPARVAGAGASSGEPLPGGLRERFEQSLGADLTGVRVHTGRASADAAASIHARAFTGAGTGADIRFADGAYDPGSTDGQHLLAHEVAHTVQQRGVAARPQAKLEISTPGDASEREADAAADAMLAGRPVTVSAVSNSVLARDPAKTRMPANQPGSGLDAGMFTVKGGEPVHSGTVTADKVDSKVRLTSPEVSFSAEVTMPKPLGDGERIDVGPVQTMLSSSRIGVYREGGRQDGKIVAEQTMNLGEMRDATGEIGKDGKLDQATMPPFYSAPTAFNSSTSNASISFKDRPKAVFPSTVGKGKLTETKGQAASRHVPPCCAAATAMLLGQRAPVAGAAGATCGASSSGTAAPLAVAGASKRPTDRRGHRDPGCRQPRRNRDPGAGRPRGTDHDGRGAGRRRRVRCKIARHAPLYPAARQPGCL